MADSNDGGFWRTIVDGAEVASEVLKKADWKFYNGETTNYVFDMPKHFNRSVVTGVGKLSSGLLTYYNVFDTVWSVSNNLYDGNYRQAFIDTCGFIGGLLGGGLAGYFFKNPILSIMGYAIGKKIFSVAGEYAAKYLSEEVYDRISYIYNQCCKLCSGVSGMGDTGGVEFVPPVILPEFKENFCNVDSLFISFKKYSPDSEQSILDLLNNKLLINGAHFNNMNEVFSTIMNELAIGYLVDKKLPYISLNFNKEGLLYPIMDEYYKHTLVGCIITMLDYYLKCYVNGGFFMEEFIYEWQKNKNTDKFYLEQNFFNMKTYLVSVLGDKNEILYQSMNDMKSNDYNNGEQIFLSAFRIIGKIDDQLKCRNNLLIPDCYYDVEYDIDISPKFKASAINDENKQNIIKENEKIHKLMAFLVKAEMDSIPYFKPYFELLNIITFCLHYLPNVQACGMFCNLSKSLVKNNKQYISNIPHVFPPLPIKKPIEIAVHVTMKELIDMFSERQKQIINNIISIRFLEMDIDLETMKRNNECIERSITTYMNDKLKQLLGSDAYLVDITSDNNLGIFRVINMFSSNLDSLVCGKVIRACSEIYGIMNILIKEFKFNGFQNDFDLEGLIKYKTFNELNNQVNELLRKYRKLLEKVKVKLIEINEENKKRFKNEWTNARQKAYEETKKGIRNEVETQCRDHNKSNMIETIMNSQEVKNWLAESERKVTEHYQNLYNEQMREYEKDLNEKLKLTDLRKMDNDLVNTMTKLQNDLIDSTFLNGLEDDVINVFKFEYQLKLQSLSFDLSSESMSKLDVRGGCRVNLNNNLILVDNSIDKELYQSIIQEKNNDYYCIESKLVNSPLHGDSLDELVKDKYDLNKEKLITAVLHKTSTHIKDYSGFSIGHYKALLGDYESIMESELHSKSYSGITIELIAVSTGNIKMVSDLIKLNESDFSTPSHNGITPLLMAILNKDEPMINLLLDYPHKIGDINYTNELNRTYLYYACFYNMPNIAKRIVLLNGKMEISDKKVGDCPLHLLCKNSNSETLKTILEMDTTYFNINIQRPDDKTPYHLSSINSILCTKLLAKSNAMTTLKDCYGYDCYDLSIYSGRIDCYQQLPKRNRYNSELHTKIKKAIESPNSIHEKSDKLKYIGDLFREGKLKEIENIIPFIKETLPIKDSNRCIELISAAVKGRNKESIKYLSQLVDLKKNPLMPFIGKNGLIDWIKEAIGHGSDLYESYNNATIFDGCVEKNDYNMLKYIFSFIDNVDNRLNDILSNVICKAVINNKIKLLCVLSEQLKSSKFKKIQLSITSLCNTPDITLRGFELILRLFKCIDLSTINYINAIKYCRPNVFKKMLNLQEKLPLIILETLEKTGEKRKDNLSILAEYDPIHFSRHQYDQELLESIENIIKEKDRFIEASKQRKLTRLLQRIDIGLTELPKCKRFIIHHIFKTHSFWALKSLSDAYANYFFIKDENECYPFDYLVPSLALEKEILSIFDYFDSLKSNESMKANLILTCLDRMIPIFNHLQLLKCWT